MNDAAVTMTGIFTKTNIGNNIKVRIMLFNKSKRLLNDSLLIPCFRPDFIFSSWNTKQEYSRYTQCSNLIELLSGTDPTDVDSVPAFAADSLEAFVIEELANSGVLEQDSASIGPYDDYDADTISNVVELMYATNPNDDTDTPVLSPLDITVAEALAALLNSGQYGIGLTNIGPTDDFDADGVSNIDELNNVTNPNDASDPGP